MCVLLIVKREIIDSLLLGSHEDAWDRSLSNEWGQSEQGDDTSVTGTDATKFIHKSEAPTKKLLLMPLLHAIIVHLSKTFVEL